MKTKNYEILKNRFADVLVVTLLLGSLWGFLAEIILKSAAIRQGFPFKGGMAGYIVAIGIGIMGIALGNLRKTSLLMGIPLVAILSRLLVLSIFNLPLVARINSSLAIFLGGIALTGIIALAGDKLYRSHLLRLFSGLSAGLLAAVSFFFIGMRIMPCPYLLSFNRAGGFEAFMSSDGMVWMFFSGILFYAGCWLGARLKDASLNLSPKQSLIYYSGSAFAIVCCWVIMALSIISGS